MTMIASCHVKSIKKSIKTVFIFPILADNLSKKIIELYDTLTKNWNKGKLVIKGLS